MSLSVIIDNIIAILLLLLLLLVLLLLLLLLLSFDVSCEKQKNACVVYGRMTQNVMV